MENEKEKALYYALTDLDCLSSELEDLAHLLTMHDENLTECIDPLRKGESWGGKYLMDRWPLHLSMLNVIRFRLKDILEELQTGIKKGYDALGVHG
jgi:hypothetical protein